MSTLATRRRTLPACCGVAALLVASGAAVISPPPAASASPAVASAPTMSVSPASGPVGTVVSLRGDVGSGCRAAFDPGLQFEDGSSGPVDRIVLPIAPDGAWTATFVIPPFVGGAATRGLFGADVTPGIWEFVSPGGCAGESPMSARFDVTGTSTSQPPSRFAAIAVTPDGNGYWLAESGGVVLAFGDARSAGSLARGGIAPASPIVAIAATGDGRGYWLAGGDGGVFAFGDARFYGSLPARGIEARGVIVSIAPTPDDRGYWLLGADGGVFAFGDARFHGAGGDGFGLPMVALSSIPGGGGYFAFPATGEVPFAYGDARLPADQARQEGPLTMDALVSGAVTTPDGAGDWEVGTDGGVFAFGNARFYGSLPSRGITPDAPVVAIARTPDGRGYWLLGADGAVFAFGDARYHGSAGGSGLAW